MTEPVDEQGTPGVISDANQLLAVVTAARDQEIRTWLHTLQAWADLARNQGDQELADEYLASAERVAALLSTDPG